jgi:hypothetical protein
MFYSRRQFVGIRLKKFPIFTIYPFDEYPNPYHVRDYHYFLFPDAVKTLCPNDGFSSLQEEWEWLKSVEGEINEDELPNPPFDIKLPGYASMRSEETEGLHKRHLRAMDRLARMFCGRKFSEVIVEEARK